MEKREAHNASGCPVSKGRETDSERKKKVNRRLTPFAATLQGRRRVHCSQNATGLVQTESVSQNNNAQITRVFATK